MLNISLCMFLQFVHRRMIKHAEKMIFLSISMYIAFLLIYIRKGYNIGGKMLIPFRHGEKQTGAQVFSSEIGILNLPFNIMKAFEKIKLPF